MFNKLVASNSKSVRRGGLFGAKTMTVSLALHGALLAGAVYATVNVVEVEEEEEEVTFVELEEEQPEPEPPPPDMPNLPPPPQGFQELIPPSVPPPFIPPIDNTLAAVRVEDFSGIGQAGGTNRGPATPAPVAVTRDSVFEVSSLDYDARPDITNRAQLPSILSRFYPRLLQDAGIGGRVVVQAVILPEGRIDPASIKIIESSNPQFEDATRQALERFTFRPGRYQGRAVSVLIELPVTWQVGRF